MKIIYFIQQKTIFSELQYLYCQDEEEATAKRRCEIESPGDAWKQPCCKIFNILKIPNLTKKLNGSMSI